MIAFSQGFLTQKHLLLLLCISSSSLRRAFQFPFILGEYDPQGRVNRFFQVDDACIPIFPFEQVRGDI